MNTEAMFFMMQTGAATHRGMVRDHNEDAFVRRPESGLWAVADGMGGHDAGDIASGTIAEELASVGVPGSGEDLRARFTQRLNHAHQRIRAHSASLGGATVGATLVALLVFENRFEALWSGDSRIYMLRDGTLRQLTRDHTEVQALLDSGAISAEEARTWPRRNVITRAIGVTELPECDAVSDELAEGDVFLLCSDGLTEHHSDTDLAVAMAAVAQGSTDAQGACDALIAQTLERGARDNVTVVILSSFAAPESEEWGTADV